MPFTEPSTNDTLIERMRVKMTYLMQNQTGKADNQVEPEANYKPLENILFADMVCYQLVKTKAIQNMAGNGTTAGGTKILKRAKADVTEAEFVITKAEDGSLIQIDTTTFLKDLLAEICAEAQVLNYNVPWCTCPPDVIPAFIVGEDYPAPLPDSDTIFNEQPIGM